MRKTKQSDSSKFNGMPVNARPGENVDTEMLERLHNLQSNYLNKHNKVYQMFLTLRYPQNSEQGGNDNRPLTQMIHSLKTNLSRHKYDPVYAWCTEKNPESSAVNLHHHVCLMMNGNMIQHPNIPFEKAKELWAQSLEVDSGDGLVNYGTKNEDGRYGRMIKRNDPKTIEDGFYHLSYLAKTNTKDGVPNGVRHFGVSKITQRRNKK